MAVAQPLKACQPLTNAALLQGAAVVVQRGDCTFEAKARAVQAAGGALVIITDNQAGSYFVLAAADTASTTVRPCFRFFFFCFCFFCFFPICG